MAHAFEIKRTTLKELAAASGVSIRTARRVLSEAGYASESAKRAVRQAAARLRYRPDPAARALRMGRSDHVVMVVASLDELHTAKIAAMERRLREAGFLLSLSFLLGQYDQQAVDAFLGPILDRKPAGVGFILSEPGARWIGFRLKEGGFPAVAVDSPGGRGLAQVQIDRPSGVAEAVRHVVGCGHRSVAYLGSPHHATRLKGFNQAVEEGGVRGSLISCESEEAARAVGRMFGRLRQRPDAVQAYSDAYALAFAQGLGDAGLKPGRDVALVGFDDRWAARLAAPPLTTVAQPSEAVGCAAAELLLDQIQGSGARKPRRALLPTRLVVRESG